MTPRAPEGRLHSSITRLHAGLLVALAVALGVILWRTPHAKQAVSHPRPDDRALAMLLPGAALLVTVDLEALGKSAWGRAALARLAALAGPAKDVGCAERQLGTMQRLAVALPFVPPKGAAVEIGLVAEGAFQASSLVSCATELMNERRGAPATSRVNDFIVLRDRRGAGELAVKQGGPLILSGGDYFRDLLDREAGGFQEELGLTEKLHLSLRARARSAPVLATWVLPPGWLERWLSDPELGQSPLGSIRAVVVRGEADRELSLRVQVSAESAAAAERLEPFLRRFGAGAVAFLSGGAARPPAITRDEETIAVELTSQGFDGLRMVRALTMLDESSGAPSHALDRPDAEQVEPGAERAAGGRAQ